jgi:hypothetical protein
LIRNERLYILTLERTRWQYTEGVTDPESVSPESYTLDWALLERPGNKEIQLDLFLDYASNVKLYPKIQEYFRKSKPPLLAIWGKNDPFFIPPGAEAFRKDLPDARIQFLDTGHFALETHVMEIASAMRTGHLFYPHDHDLARNQSRNLGSIYTVLCGASGSDLLHVRITVIGYEHESRAILWLGSSR